MHPDHPFMRRALDLALATTGLASPNPQVGCVLVKHETIIGEGAHLYDRYDHAEIAALKSSTESPARSTAYFAPGVRATTAQLAVAPAALLHRSAASASAAA